MRDGLRPGACLRFRSRSLRYARITGVGLAGTRITDGVNVLVARSSAVLDKPVLLEFLSGIAKCPRSCAGCLRDLRVSRRNYPSTVPLALVHKEYVQTLFPGSHPRPKSVPYHCLRHTEIPLEHHCHLKYPARAIRASLTCPRLLLAVIGSPHPFRLACEVRRSCRRRQLP